MKVNIRLLLFILIILLPFQILIKSPLFCGVYNEKEANVYLEIYKEKLDKYFSYPEKQSLITEETSKYAFQEKKYLKIKLDRKQYSGAGILFGAPVDLSPILEFGYLIFAIRGEKGNERVLIGLDNSNDPEGKSLNTSVRLSKYIKLSKDWQEVKIPLKDFPVKIDSPINKGGFKKFDFSSCIAFRISATPSKKETIPESIVYLNDCRIKYDDEKILTGLYTRLINNQNDMLYTYSYPKNSSKVEWIETNIMKVSLYTKQYSGASLGFAIKNLIPVRDTGILEFKYKPLQGQQIFNICLVNSGLIGGKTENRLLNTLFINKSQIDWQTVRIPLRKFSDYGIYWNGHIEMINQFKWEDVTEIKFNKSPDLGEANTEFLIKDFLIKKEKETEDNTPIWKLFTPIKDIITKDNSEDGVYLGFVTQGVEQNFNLIGDFQQLLGKKMAQVMWFIDWTSEFPLNECKNLIANNIIPHIVWQPWYYNEPDKIKLDNIINGDYDNYIKKFAQDVKKFAKPIFLRWGHEFNLPIYPWGIINNNKDPKKYITAYRHIHDIFKDIGANNVLWIWSPNNVSYPVEKWNDFIMAYPGDNYVDWIGIDGYNFGTSQDWSSWTSFDGLFQNVYRHILLNNLNKPIMIAEFGCSEEGGDKTIWLNEMDKILKEKYHRIKSIVFFNLTKETDWRLESSFRSARTAKKIFSDAYYLTSDEKLSRISSNFSNNLIKIQAMEKQKDFFYTSKKSLSIPIIRNIDINGNLNKWQNTKGILIDEKWYISNKLFWQNKNPISGTIKLAWDGKENLLFIADIKDKSPLNNPFTMSDIWKGDCLEMTIGFPSSPNDSQIYMGSNGFQFGISPGDGKNRKPLIWIWQKNKEAENYEVISKKTDNGYIIEGRIPFMNFTSTLIKPGDHINFDMAIDDLDKGAIREDQIIWNGNEAYYSDPSLWGEAVFQNKLQ